MSEQSLVYPAVLTPGEGVVLVRFPDLPEALTEGHDRADALRQASDCLDEAIAGRIARGEPIPRPSRRGRGHHPVAVPPQTAIKAALTLAFREADITKSELARRLGCDVREARRLLDPRYPSKLPRIAEALSRLDKGLAISLYEEMKPIETEKFIHNYEVAVCELSRLLKTRFTPKRPETAALGQSLAQIMMLHLKSDYVGRDIEFERIKLLVIQLQRIKRAAPAVLRKLVKPLRTAKDIDRFYGIRFEVNIAATLILNKVQFDKQESPDFGVHWRGKELGIECAGSHIMKAKRRDDYLYKIGSKISEKEKRNYCNNRTGLFLDVTNLEHHAEANGMMWTNEQLRRHVSDSVARLSFGNVTCFTYLFTSVRLKIE